jgi:hypothetical protein
MLGREHCRPYVPEHFDRKKQKVGALANRKVFAVTDPPEELSPPLLKGLALTRTSRHASAETCTPCEDQKALLVSFRQAYIAEAPSEPASLTHCGNCSDGRSGAYHDGRQS